MEWCTVPFIFSNLTYTANFPVTTDMVKGSLNRGKTLDEEMKVNKCSYCMDIGYTDSSTRAYNITAVAIN